MRIQNVADDTFRRYGKVLEGYDFTELLKEMKHTPVPEDVTYVPSVEEMEALPVAKEEIKWSGIPPQLRNQCCSDRPGIADRTSAGCRKGFYI